MSKIGFSVGCLVFAACRVLQAAPVPHIYKWADAQGQPHYSDMAPANRGHLMMSPGNQHPAPTKGLRPGERATLQAIEKRQKKQHQAAKAAHRSQRQVRIRQRQACDNARNKLRHSNIHTDSKAWSMYLREHCW